ncbi:non-canonical purine NTP pyrophosphatase, partial [Candidatus Falkowbacteria bacterium]|nr:non-canonical purine NTP pyrophosphatase [Candidatus Falkowbacteria bacterium]
GTITTEKRGVDRPKLPYDLIFQPEGYNETFAEMSDDQKNSLSHRGKAFQQMRQFIEAELKLLTAKN